MSVTISFAIAAGHHLEPTGSFGNSRARPLRSPPGVRHSFLLASDFHPVPGSSFAIPPAAWPGGCRLFWVSGNAPNPLTLRRKNRYRAGPNLDTHTIKIRATGQRHAARFISGNTQRWHARFCSISQAHAIPRSALPSFAPSKPDNRMHKSSKNRLPLQGHVGAIGTGCPPPQRSWNRERLRKSSRRLLLQEFILGVVRTVPGLPASTGSHRAPAAWSLLRQGQN